MQHPPVTDFATDFDHTDEAWVADPYPIMEDLRERCPIAHSERYGGMWAPMTHEAVSAIANDTEHFTSRTVVITEGRPGDDAPPAPIGVAPPISSDPPFHEVARRLLLPAFAPRPVNALEGFSRDLCTSLIDDMGDAEVIDASLQYTQHIPVGVIAKMVGLPPADGDLFRHFVHEIIEAVDLPVEERIARFQPIEEYIVGLIEDHRANPTDDLISYLLDVEIGGNKLLDEHVFGTIVLLIVAGIDTTWSAIGSSLWHLAQNPDDLARLVAHPELIPSAVEEFLRAYAPVTMARLVKEDFEFQGCPMKKDDWILLSFPAANRDPEFFDNADQVLIDREINRHSAFGLGIHRCLGSNLARLEMVVAIEEFIRRFPRFELADPSAVTFSQGQVRGPRSLPIRILERA
ncbi:MAG: cytochrome P450 [Acidobacteria bacterium]|nr:cytochrome P450 [Acidobacteriota bacterium]